MRNLQLEFGADIARAVVNFEGPILFLVVSRYHGGAYVVFSQELNSGLRAAALEGAHASVIGGAAAAQVVFGREVENRARRADTVRAAEVAYERSPGSAASAARRLDVGSIKTVMGQREYYGQGVLDLGGPFFAGLPFSVGGRGARCASVAST